MGTCLSYQDRVAPVSESELDRASVSTKDAKLSDFAGPVKQRTCTDVFFLILMFFFYIVLLVLVGYCIWHGDIFRIINGYDSCGNICGRKNYPEPNPEFSCKGVDTTKNKFLLITEAGKNIVDSKNVFRQCVSDCKSKPGFVEFLNRCIPNKSEDIVISVFSKTGLSNFFQEASEDLHLCWTEMLFLCLIAFGISVILLFLFRYVAGFVVWLVLLGVIITSIIGTTYLWIMYKQKSSQKNLGDIEKRNETIYLAYATVSTVVTVIILLVVLVMRKRIQLVVQLFIEAGKAVNSMPLLLCQPLVTFVALALVVTTWLIFELWIESSGIITTVPDSQNLYFKKDTTMKVTRWYNLFAVFWFTQFCIGCQHMVVAGAVATWFFTRNKDDIKSPISTSAKNLIRYHLGSVALGSFVISLVTFVRAVLMYVQSQLKSAQNDVTKCLFRACQCCLYCFEKFLAYVTRNAYIEIAIFGDNFCTSGQQAFQILTNNVLRVAAINSVGDFVLFLGKVLVVATTALIGIKVLEEKQGLQHMWVPLTLVGLFAYLVSHCFITVYEMVIDTIFLCFCEDCEMNDGINKPFFMSRGLMEFVQKSKKVLAVGDGADTKEQAWSASTQRQSQS